MHDIRQIRDNPTGFDAALKRRGLAPMAADILAIDEARRGSIRAAEDALAARNSASKEVGAAKAKGDEVEFERLRNLVAEKKDEIARLEALQGAELNVAKKVLADEVTALARGADAAARSGGDPATASKAHAASAARWKRCAGSA